MPRPGIALPGSVSARDARALARRAEAAGCDAVWTLDVRRDPYLLAAAALDATEALPVGTNVAVAFARSPTVTAVTAWDLSASSGGRFVLGLGSQVGPTLRARFGVEADHPGPRLRDYVGATRACFDAFAHGYGRYDGEFYRIRRPAFQPGADPVTAPPPIYVAAVNPYMTAIAGECADGLAAHPFTTEAYIEEVMRPALRRGAERAGRPVPPVLLQLVVAPDRELAAKQMIAYTVPAYRRVLDHAGLGEVADQIMEASARGDRNRARDLIETGYLDRLGVATLDDLPSAVARWSAHCDRLSLSVPWFGMDDADQLALVSALLDRLTDLPPG